MKEPWIKEHHIEVARTARFATLGKAAAGTREVWFVLHGYQQLARRFIQYCSALDDGRTFVVAPEGLSRFYVEDAGGAHGPDSAVGASWMTREDRELEIQDYVRYLDALHDHVFSSIERSSARLCVLGFSQGAATACRWLCLGKSAIDRLVLWGGFWPGDVDLAAGRERLGRVRLDLVVGDADEFVPPSRVAEEEKRLTDAGIRYELSRFEGRHYLNRHLLRELKARG